MAAIVAAVQQCCACLTMCVVDEADAVIVTVDAPDGAELVLQELVDAFRVRRRAA